MNYEQQTRKAVSLIANDVISFQGQEYTVVLNRLTARVDPCLVTHDAKGTTCYFVPTDIPDLVM